MLHAEYSRIEHPRFLINIHILNGSTTEIIPCCIFLIH